MTFPLFQFWHADSPPEEVARLIETWRAEPGFRHRLYDAGSAADYIAEHIGARAAEAFATCAVPAMQADFFRYCALYTEAGVYADAGMQSLGNLLAFTGAAARGILMTRREAIPNGFIFIREARHPLLGRCIEQAIANIDNRISNNVWEVTGPGIMTDMYHGSDEDRTLFEGIDIYPEAGFSETLHMMKVMDYKRQTTDWRAFLKPGAPSIFRDPA